MEFNELTYACALNRVLCGKGRAGVRIAEQFDYPSQIFNCSESKMREVFGNNEKYISALNNKKMLQECAAEVEWNLANGITMTYYNDSTYPKRLKECPDAPILLFSKGKEILQSQRMIAVVGTRKPTPYGLNICSEIIRGLSHLSPKPIIVSGLAYGIDICAHKCALEYGCDTIAVLGTSLEHIYPQSHYNYSKRIEKSGLLVSEYNRGTLTKPHHFLQRNRIIAGLCEATLLIESRIQGGGMVTASIANSYSREVYAVPGRADDISSQGCNTLIGHNIAKLITCSEEICQDLGWNVKITGKGKKSKIENLLSRYDGIKRNIILTLTADLYLDLPSLIDRCNEEPSKILSAVTELEMEQIIEIDIYGYYHICL